MKVAVVGCGVIGQRRVQNLPSSCTLVACCDVNEERAASLASENSCSSYKSSEEMLEKEKPELCLVATINSELTKITQQCLDRGIAVLVEKPAARCLRELKTLVNPKNVPVKVGFNHRYHPAFAELKKRLAAASEDPIMYIRARYGNGARVGFNKEWRANPELSGGGELLDQGVHVLDLALQLVPGLQVKSAMVRSLFWDMPVDDNSWALLENQNKQCFSMHVSSSEWKNEFQFDVYTRMSKYTWSGLGRSYGMEKLTHYQMSEQMGPPEVETVEFPAEDNSWRLELEDFIDSIKTSSSVGGGTNDAEKVLGLVKDIYEKSKENHAGPHPQWT